MWYARSSEFMQQNFMETLRWLRIVGDTVFLSGVAAFAWFVLGLITGRSYRRDRTAQFGFDERACNGECIKTQI